MVSVEYSEATVEVLEVLNFLDEEEREKIPDEIIEFFENNKSKTYKPDIKYEKDISKLKIKNKTKEILAGLYLDYLCNEDEKNAFIQKIRENQIRYEQELKENYGEFNIFDNKQADKKVENEQLAFVKKETFFTRVIKRIKRWFKL